MQTLAPNKDHAMNMFLCLLRDEAGLVLSAEAVVIGTVGVVGAAAGLAAVSRSTNDELAETAFAIRSIDQSFRIEGDSRCGACIAGSQFTQPPVEESLNELREQYAKDQAAEQKRLETTENKQAAKKQAENESAEKLDPPKKEDPAPKKSPKTRKHKKNKRPKPQNEDVEIKSNEPQDSEIPLNI